MIGVADLYVLGGGQPGMALQRPVVLPRAKALPAVLAAVLAVLTAGCGRRAAEWKETRTLMGTLVSVTAVAGAEDVARAAVEAAFGAVARVEGLMSLHDEASELSLVNAGVGEGLVAVSAETFSVLEAALGYCEASGGAFDVTVGPLVRAWGFYRSGEAGVPPEVAIAALLPSVGWETVKLEPESRAVSFAREGMEIDLGAIAKGYAADVAAEAALAAGARAVLVDAGGDIRCAGLTAQGCPWRIGVQHPRRRGELVGVLEITDRAVTTSGDYERFFVYDGVRYAHIIDPRTGWPVANGVESVTVLAPTAMQADALSTSLFVLGPVEGLALAGEYPGVSALIMTADPLDPGRLVYHRTPDLADLELSQ